MMMKQFAIVFLLLVVCLVWVDTVLGAPGKCPISSTSLNDLKCEFFLKNPIFLVSVLTSVANSQKAIGLIQESKLDDAKACLLKAFKLDVRMIRIPCIPALTGVAVAFCAINQLSSRHCGRGSG
jgi:hypothetical protein